ncbi:MAG: YihA family ribosome biogenesis GTP-binding protein [Clostridia bacterium]|nr:YihA family ribosome biogenesis GTP-binding protein [Clostridia bacterium]MBR6603747.1 YihA family ribosome biogenesis GTP-binding protein [Clostridia bacterium]
MPLNTQNVKLRISAGQPKQFPRDAIPQVTFSGRSNVGKSSLINTLLGRKSLARVSSAPGKTITVNFYDVDGKLFLVDLPGYGYAKRTFEDKKQWSALTDGYFTNNPNIDLLSLVIQLIDIRVGITADDRMMIDFLVQSQLPFIIVTTKSDKPNKTDRKKSLEAIAADPSVPKGTPIIPFSSLSGEGKQELWQQISLFTEVK